MHQLVRGLLGCNYLFYSYHLGLWQKCIELTDKTIGDLIAAANNLNGIDHAAIASHLLESMKMNEHSCIINRSGSWQNLDDCESPAQLT